MSSVLEPNATVRHLSDRDVLETVPGGRLNQGFVSRETAVGAFVGDVSTRMTVRIESAARPLWLRDVVDQLASLGASSAALREAPLSVDAVMRAVDFLRSVMKPDTAPPFIAELIDGGLQLEWHRGGIDVEVHVPRDGASILLYEEVDGPEEWEGPVDFGLQIFATRVRDRLALREDERY